MNNLLSYCGLVKIRISASEKDLPVSDHNFKNENLVFIQRHRKRLNSNLPTNLKSKFKTTLAPSCLTMLKQSSISIGLVLNNPLFYALNMLSIILQANFHKLIFQNRAGGTSVQQFRGQNLILPLVGIGLTDLSKSGRHCEFKWIL